MYSVTFWAICSIFSLFCLLPGNVISWPCFNEKGLWSDSTLSNSCNTPPKCSLAPPQMQIGPQDLQYLNSYMLEHISNNSHDLVKVAGFFYEQDFRLLSGNSQSYKEMFHIFLTVTKLLSILFYVLCPSTVDDVSDIYEVHSHTECSIGNYHPLLSLFLSDWMMRSLYSVKVKDWHIPKRKFSAV